MIQKEGTCLCTLLGFSGWSLRGTQISCCEGLLSPEGGLCTLSWPYGLSYQALGFGQEDLPPAAGSTPLSRFCTPALPLQVQVLLYFLQLEAIPAPDSKRQSILFSTEV